MTPFTFLPCYRNNTGKTTRQFQRTWSGRGSCPHTDTYQASWEEEFWRGTLKSCLLISMRLGFLCPTWMLKIPFPTTSNRTETPASCTTASNTEVTSQSEFSAKANKQTDMSRLKGTIRFADNTRHLERGCKRPCLETSAAVSEEHYFRSAPPYESSLLSHPYCTEAFNSREACMYGGVETESGSSGGDTDNVNCNMWATMQPYPRYAVEGVPYQPFAAHFANAATVSPVVSHSASSIASRPQADLGVYNSATVQRGLPIIAPSSSSSSSCSPVVLGPRDRSEHPAPYHKKPDSPLRSQRDFSSYHSQGTVSIREPSFQYQAGLSGTGTQWSDS